MIIEGDEPRIPWFPSKFPSIYGGSTKYGGQTNRFNLPTLLSYSSNLPLLKDDSKLLISSVCWQAICNTICMILVIMRMKVLSEKRKELSQTIASLIGSIRTEEGCRRCDFCQSMEDENELCLLEEWDTQGNLKGHLKSERFRVLRGAMNLLQEPYEIMFHTVFHPAGMKEI